MPKSETGVSPRQDKSSKSTIANLENFTRTQITGAHKQEISSLHFYMRDQDGNSKNQKFITTSTDGFIKMWDSYDASAKKSFFVCPSGITASTPIAQQDSFALAGLDNNIYLFSFHTGTSIQQFCAHDDTITALCFKNVSPLD